jgi:hypothetical protein
MFDATFNNISVVLMEECLQTIHRMLINVALRWVYGRITTRKKEDDE